MLLQGLAAAAADKGENGRANEQKVMTEQATDPPIHAQTDVVPGRPKEYRKEPGTSGETSCVEDRNG